MGRAIRRPYRNRCGISRDGHERTELYEDRQARAGPTTAHNLCRRLDIVRSDVFIFSATKPRVGALP